MRFVCMFVCQTLAPSCPLCWQYSPKPQLALGHSLLRAGRERAAHRRFLAALELEEDRADPDAWEAAYNVGLSGVSLARKYGGAPSMATLLTQAQKSLAIAHAKEPEHKACEALLREANELLARQPGGH
mmetsp:Transcript_30169/g.82762  ORF Transcript_30169/g.82762 Transcript_30169/m.82762 type:complete len:129 (-) Transcript_30169:74-460(-)|eukprot:7386336-Prymnesium_polylepis.3